MRKEYAWSPVRGEGRWKRRWRARMESTAPLMMGRKQPRSHTSVLKVSDGIGRTEASAPCAVAQVMTVLQLVMALARVLAHSEEGATCVKGRNARCQVVGHRRDEAVQTFLPLAVTGLDGSGARDVGRHLGHLRVAR